MRENFVFLFDCDTGQDVGDVVAAAQREGWLVATYPSHSHNKTATEISETQLIAWARKNKRLDGATLENAVAYLQETKHARPALFEGAALGERRQIEGGMHLALQHTPWAKEGAHGQEDGK